MKCTYCPEHFLIKDLAKIGNRYICFKCSMTELEDF
jgi:ribosomal protein S27AE